VPLDFWRNVGVERGAAWPHRIVGEQLDGS
jgi:hypothetical protein